MGPELQGGKTFIATDIPRYLSVVNAHQRGWDSVTFVIGIAHAHPGVRLALD
jgi:hypothetical protein